MFSYDYLRQPPAVSSSRRLMWFGAHSIKSVNFAIVTGDFNMASILFLNMPNNILC